MHEIVNIPAVQIIIGTLPVTALLAWNLMEVKILRSEMAELRASVDKLAEKVSELAERVAKIEGKIEGHHVVLEN